MASSAHIKALFVAVVLPLTFWPLSAAASGSAAAASGAGPVGTWGGTVKLPDETHETDFSFTRTGTACLSFGGPGEVSGSGVGSWWPTGPNRFAFRIRHGVYDPSGVLIGSVQVNQEANQNQNTFTSSGTSTIYAADGTQTGTAPAEVSATRTSTAEPHCG